MNCGSTHIPLKPPVPVSGPPRLLACLRVRPHAGGKDVTFATFHAALRWDASWRSIPKTRRNVCSRQPGPRSRKDTLRSRKSPILSSDMPGDQSQRRTFLPTRVDALRSAPRSDPRAPAPEGQIFLSSLRWMKLGGRGDRLTVNGPDGGLGTITHPDLPK
jgi:hypothetical protein